MAKRVTINMVAERAGVSRGTVDRVLNQRPHVRTEVYEKVMQTARELKYVPSNEEKAHALGLEAPDDISCKLGVVLPNWRGHFKREIMRGIEDAQRLLEVYAVEIIAEECETNLTDEIVERVDSLCSRHCAGIAICAKDDIVIAGKINELHDGGIPVVTFNSDIMNSKRLCFVGQDLMRGGRVAGELMMKCLRPGERLVIAVGNSEYNGHRVRMQGFRQRVRENGFRSTDIEIIETYNDYDLTYQKVKEVLERVPDLKGIYMANHSVTGCVEAVRAVGRQGKIHVISHDLTYETKRLLQKNEIDFTIAQNIYRQGYQPFIILREYIQQGALPGVDSVQPAIEIICAENLAEKV